jgi:hypothetical protein
MKRARIILLSGLVAVTALSFTAKTQDADKQALIGIEDKFAAQTTPGPDLGALVKQYTLDGPLDQLTPHGRIGSMAKARVAELQGKPDPTDPDVKSTTKNSDYHVDIFGDTAVVMYKETNTDVGHKDPAFNATEHFGCLDTFVKRSGQWYEVANACTPSSPLPAAEWTATKKAITEEPKDVQQAYH